MMDGRRKKSFRKSQRADNQRMNRLYLALPEPRSARKDTRELSTPGNEDQGPELAFMQSTWKNAMLLETWGWEKVYNEALAILSVQLCCKTCKSPTERWKKVILLCVCVCVIRRLCMWIHILSTYYIKQIPVPNHFPFPSQNFMSYLRGFAEWDEKE